MRGVAGTQPAGNFEVVFRTLRGILERQAGNLRVKNDSP